MSKKKFSNAYCIQLILFHSMSLLPFNWIDAVGIEIFHPFTFGLAVPRLLYSAQHLLLPLWILTIPANNHDQGNTISLVPPFSIEIAQPPGAFANKQNSKIGNKEQKKKSHDNGINFMHMTKMTVFSPILSLWYSLFNIRNSSVTTGYVRYHIEYLDFCVGGIVPNSFHSTRESDTKSKQKMSWTWSEQGFV